MNLISTSKLPGNILGNLAFTGSLFLHVGVLALFSSWQWEWKTIEKKSPETIRVKFLSAPSSSQSAETSNSAKPSPRVPARPRSMQPVLKSLFSPRTPNSSAFTLQSMDVVHKMIQSHKKIVRRSLAQPAANTQNKLFPGKAPENFSHPIQRTVVHHRPPALELQTLDFSNTSSNTAISTRSTQSPPKPIHRLPSPDESKILAQISSLARAGVEQPASAKSSSEQFSALPRELSQNTAEAEDTFDTDPNALRGLFIGQVRQRIANAKYYPRMARRRGMEGQPVIAFTLNKNGRLMKVDLAQTSGYQLLDQAALEAVHQGAPYPEIPAELKRDTFKFKLPISFALK